MNMGDGMNYAPKGKPSPVVKPGEFFCFAAAYANHGHIYGMCNGLTEAGGILKYIYDPDRERAENLQKAFPGAILAESEEQILSDPEIRLVASAAVTSERCAVGLRVMEAGKDYFTDKAPFTTLAQLESARETVRRTGQKIHGLLFGAPAFRMCRLRRRPDPRGSDWKRAAGNRHGAAPSERLLPSGLVL